MMGDVFMNTSFNYRKPCMTNLPAELGYNIINTIMRSEKPKLERAKAESERIKSAVLARGAYEKSNTKK